MDHLKARRRFSTTGRSWQPTAAEYASLATELGGSIGAELSRMGHVWNH